MRIDCKCHGMSGSCNFQTCWKRMPTFRDVGNRLRIRFDTAKHVTVSNNNNDQRLVLFDRTESTMPHAAVEKSKMVLTKEDLVYSEESLNFCQRRKKLGSLGTRGRQCDPTPKSNASCDVLCCERGYVTENVIIHENCNCRFQWCCEVTCLVCKREQTIHKCR